MPISEQEVNARQKTRVGRRSNPVPKEWPACGKCGEQFQELFRPPCCVSCWEKQGINPRTGDPMNPKLTKYPPSNPIDPDIAGYKVGGCAPQSRKNAIMTSTGSYVSSAR